jgi:tRNA pseudouridine55 synthase
MAKRRSSTQPTGFVLIDKPVGPSSNMAVQLVRAALGVGGRRGTKGGHAGTLDPFADGLLVVLLGHATKLMPHIVGHDKRYLVGVTFGASSDTDDATGTLTPSDAPLPNIADVEAACARLAASTTQVPPAVSALHIDGKRAYARVRAGETVVVPARAVRIDAIEVLTMGDGPGDLVGTITLDVRCGTGTYMRALARDLGELVGCPAHCSTLRRTAVGEWSVDDAIAPDAVTADDVRPVDELELMPTVRIPEERLDDILQGRAFVHDGVIPADHVLGIGAAGPLAVLTRDGETQLRTSSLLVDSPSVTGSTT